MLQKDTKEKLLNQDDSSNSSQLIDNEPVLDQTAREQQLLDKYFEDAGGVGWFQLFVILTVQCGITGFNMIFYQIAYLELFPKYQCNTLIQPNTTFECEPSDFCGKQDTIAWSIDYEDPKTLTNWVQKLDLTCESREKIGYLGSAVFAGWVMTLVMVPRLADVYGRKNVYRGGLCALFVAFSAVMMTSSINVMIVALFVCGACATCRMQVGYMVMLEYLPSSKHAFYSSLLWIIDSLVALGGVVYFVFLSKNWLWFVLIGYILTALGMVGSLFIPETPKFLMKVGKLTEFEHVMNKIAGLNGVKVAFDDGSFDDIARLQQETREKQQEEEKVSSEHSDQVLVDGSLLRYLKDKTVARNLIILLIVWPARSFDYYLSSFYLKYLPGNVHVNTFVTYGGELISYAVSGWFFNKFTMKQNLLLFLSISIAGGLSTLFYGLENPNLLLVIFIFVMRFGMSAASNVCWIGLPKLFPTLFAVTALGIVNVTAKILNIAVPVVNEMQMPKPIIVYCLVASLALVASLCLKDNRIK